MYMPDIFAYTDTMHYVLGRAFYNELIKVLGFFPDMFYTVLVSI